MLLALVGITGIGKSYYKDKIVKDLNFEKIKIVTTRAKRIGEKNNDDKIFVTNSDLEEMQKDGKIAYSFELLGNKYAYTYEALYSKTNTVFELHYRTFNDFKKICPDLVCIYLMPKDINIAKSKLRERKLAPEVEDARLKEIDEHYNRIINDVELRSKFDYIVYNNYDEQSDKEVIDLVKKLLAEGE